MIETTSENIVQYELVRKKRNPLGIFSLIAAGFINIMIEYFSSNLIIIFVLLFVHAYCIYDAIKAFSSHDIETWKHSPRVKVWIYIGCYFGGIPGVLVYYYLKRKEKKYLTNLNKNIKI